MLPGEIKENLRQKAKREWKAQSEAWSYEHGYYDFFLGLCQRKENDYWVGWQDAQGDLQLYLELNNLKSV